MWYWVDVGASKNRKEAVVYLVCEPLQARTGWRKAQEKGVQDGGEEIQ